jgi:hypothetical protein
MRLRAGLPGLRRPAALAVLRECFAGALERGDSRVVQFSIQSNHLHLLVESEGTRSQSLGMQGLGVRIARALNRHWRRMGNVFADRYHALVLRTPRQVRNVLRYVLNNARKHGWSGAGVDPYSSGSSFDGWREGAAGSGHDHAPDPVARARSWLLRVAWRRHGRIGRCEAPGS